VARESSKQMYNISTVREFIKMQRKLENSDNFEGPKTPEETYKSILRQSYFTEISGNRDEAAGYAIEGEVMRTERFLERGQKYASEALRETGLWDGINPPEIDWEDHTSILELAYATAYKTELDSAKSSAWGRAYREESLRSALIHSQSIGLKIPDKTIADITQDMDKKELNQIMKKALELSGKTGITIESYLAPRK